MRSPLDITAPAHATGAVEFVSLDDIAADERFRLRPDGDVAALASSLGRLGQLVPVELRPLPDATEDGPRWQVVAGFRRLAALRLLFRDRVLARLHGALPDGEAWALALAHAVLGEPLTVGELDALRVRLASEGAAPWAGELLDEALVRAPLHPELRERFFEFLKGPLAPVVDRTGEDETQGATEAVAPVAEPEPEPELALAPAPEPSVPAEPGAAPELQPAQSEVEAPAPEPSVPAEPGAIPELQPAQSELEAPELDPDIVEVDGDELLRGLAMRLYEVNQDLAAAFASWKDLPLDGRRLVLAQARYVAELFPFLDEGNPE